jgi:hypothetical protein
VITISQATFVDTCEEEGISSYLDYSGRGMYGCKCIGIVGSAKDLMRFTLILIEQQKVVESDDSYIEANRDDEDGVWGTIHEDWLEVRWDNMGSDTIFYWPSIQTIDDTKDPE